MSRAAAQPQSRAAMSRAASARPVDAARAPNKVLRAPKLKADDVHFRWATTAVKGQPVEQDVATSIMAGYRPVTIDDLAEDCPYRQMMKVMPSAQGDNVLRYAGLMGMVIDRELVEIEREREQRMVNERISTANSVQGARDEIDLPRGARGFPVVHEDSSSTEYLARQAST